MSKGLYVTVPPPPPPPGVPPAPAPSTSKPVGPSWVRWALIGAGALVALMILVVIAGLLAGPPPEPEPDPPVVIPDLVGLPLPDAREALDGLDLDVEEVDAEERSIFSAANWLIESTDPVAGVEVDPGAALTLHLINVRDLDDEAASGEVEAEPEPEPEPADDEAPATVPDLVGLNLREARSVANDADVELDEIDMTGRDRSVFDPSNWIVESQDPPAGDDIATGNVVTVEMSNVNDADESAAETNADDGEPEAAPDTEADDEPDSEPERRSTTLEADVSAGPAGLQIVAEDDVHTCNVNLNAGLIRAGYTSTIAMLTAGEPYVLPWSNLTDRNGERFDYVTHAPETVTIDCEDNDGNWMVDTWGW